MQALKAALVARAIEEGFCAVGVCRPDAIPGAAARLAAFLAEGRHGTMGWMAERAEWRGDPAALWPGARSVIMLAEAYTPGHDPLAVLDQPEAGAISVYAQGRDYHDVVKARLKRLGRWLIEEAGRRGPAPPEIKVFVDTAPVMEKPLAAAAGLGWQGKHTNLLGRDFGNWVFLGAIFTTLELPPDAPAEERCGTCTACLDICPTRAFPAPYQLDARRCISYLTIEHKGPVDPALRPLMGNRIYGCDDCLAVCPWNKFAAQAREVKYAAREGRVAPPLAELAALDDAGFRARFAGSPIKRIGRGRFVRNVLYAIGNSGVPGLAASARALVDDPDPVVADAAAWALSRLQEGHGGGPGFGVGHGLVAAEGVAEADDLPPDAREMGDGAA
jgi:epoxyqueuosine reductase